MKILARYGNPLLPAVRLPCLWGGCSIYSVEEIG